MLYFAWNFHVKEIHFEGDRKIDVSAASRVRRVEPRRRLLISIIFIWFNPEFDNIGNMFIYFYQIWVA